MPLRSKHFQDQAGVFAPDLDVGIEEVFQVLGLGGQLVVRRAGAGVGGQLGEHAAHLAAGNDLVAVLDHQGAGHQLVVQRLVAGLQHPVLRHTGGNDARRGEGVPDDAVHLVEGQPVFHQVLVAHKAGVAELGEAIDDPPVHPAVVLDGQGQGHLVVAQRDQRLNAQAPHLGEEVLVELQAPSRWARFPPRWGRCGSQAMETRSMVKPISAKRARSSL